MIIISCYLDTSWVLRQKLYDDKFYLRCAKDYHVVRTVRNMNFWVPITIFKRQEKQYVQDQKETSETLSVWLPQSTIILCSKQNSGVYIGH